MIYPSGRAVSLAAAGVLPAFLMALLLPGLWYLGLAWTCGIIGFALVDAVAGPPRASIGATATAPRRVSVGGTARVTIATRATGAMPARVELRLRHDARLVPQVSGSTSIVAPAREVTLAFNAMRRGIAAVDRAWLRWRGPFGLVWKQIVVPIDLGIAVTPDVDAAREQALTVLQRDAVLGDVAQRRTGEGREFEALKEYQPGMGRRFIDWKRSARHGRLLAREFQVEHNNNVVVAIDSGRLMCEPLAGVPKIDRAVTAALTTAYLALRSGDIVSLYSFDARPLVSSGATRGASSFPVIQQLAATIEYSAEETNFTLALTNLGTKLTRRSLVIVFTDFVDAVSAELMLRATGRLTERHLVLFMLMRDEELEGLVGRSPQTADDVARAVTAGALLRERELVIGRLKLLGAQVIQADYRDIGTALVERYLSLKRSDML